LEADEGRERKLVSEAAGKLYENDDGESATNGSLLVLRLSLSQDSIDDNEEVPTAGEKELFVIVEVM